ncbi:MAG: hypothetical protein LBN04_08035 [Oscillospiraceae bacterium]|jgi:hypothetical protein|nr:hypothetical protein [Oscillospiraceae bacterium]
MNIVYTASDAELFCMSASLLENNAVRLPVDPLLFPRGPDRWLPIAWSVINITMETIWRFLVRVKPGLLRLIGKEKRLPRA